MKAYYIPGTVFERSPEYYTQQIVTPSRARSVSPYNSSVRSRSSSSIHKQKSPLPQQALLQQQNSRLKDELSRILVAKMPKYSLLLQQNSQILSLQSAIQANDARISQLEAIRQELEKRVHNLIAVDGKINQILQSAKDSNNEQMCLKAARQALYRGQDRQTVSIILRNIIG